MTDDTHNNTWRGWIIDDYSLVQCEIDSAGRACSHSQDFLPDLEAMICSTHRQLELAMRSAEAEAAYRHYASRDYLERADCTGDDSSLAVAEQAIAEAEMRSNSGPLGDT